MTAARKLRTDAPARACGSSNEALPQTVEHVVVDAEGSGRSEAGPR